MSTRNHSTAVCSLPSTAARLESKGIVWLVASFLLCPCHLPLTLGLAALLMGGTAAGALLESHPVIAAIVVTAAWAAGTWRGFHLLRAARRFAGTELAGRVS